MSTQNTAAVARDREVFASRLFDAPRHLVFRAWKDPIGISDWWGPRGFTTTTHEMNFAPGGTWRFTMHGPDGVDYKNKVVYREVIESERLVYDHSGEDETDHISFVATITFEDEGDKTRLNFRMVFPTVEERKHVEQFGALEGLNHAVERLSEQLADSSDEEALEFLVTRSLHAPRELVFKAMTELEGLKNWWGPKDYTWIDCKLDLKPGGMFHYGMKQPNGDEMWGKLVYREIKSPERLAYAVSFSDREGNTLRAPFSEHWPLEVLATINFTEHNGKTTLIMKTIPINATAEEREIFISMFRSMELGWSGSFEKLAAYITKVA